MVVTGMVVSRGILLFFIKLITAIPPHGAAISTVVIKVAGDRSRPH